MRYIRIFLLHMQVVLQERGRSFVWFLMAALNPLILILFWKGAAGSKFIAPGWNFASLFSYYFLLTIVFSLLVCHNENLVAITDIKEGNLTSHLTKPFNYFVMKFLEEFTYRVLQSLYGVIVCIVFFFIFGRELFIIATNPILIILTIPVIVLALFISFTLRMIMGITAFWFTDSRGFFEAMYATEFALGGTLIPLILLPQTIANISYLLPFSYIVYFPILAIEGKLGIIDILHVITSQFIWFGLLLGIYQFLWTSGVKKFSGVGQ